MYFLILLSISLFIHYYYKYIFFLMMSENINVLLCIFIFVCSTLYRFMLLTPGRASYGCSSKGKRLTAAYSFSFIEITRHRTSFFIVYS